MTGRTTPQDDRDREPPDESEEPLADESMFDEEPEQVDEEGLVVSEDETDRTGETEGPEEGRGRRPKVA